MYRKSINTLINWKNNPHKKPLILLGARQVGKTWLMKEFGTTSYQNTVYVRFDKDSFIKSSFEKDYNVERLLTDLSIHGDTDITPGKTLIILDEIQECPAAITALKYFCEEAPDQHIIAAGSLLGISNLEGTGFPVGKINRAYLGPMTFSEFLIATGQHRLEQVISQRNWEQIKLLHEKLIDQLKHYYYIGGMPEAVQTYVNTRSFRAVREIQSSLLEDYKSDFGKHASASETHLISQIWKSLPAQLSKEDKRFIQSNVGPNVKSDRLRGPIRWLEEAGLISIIRRVTRPEMPLDAFSDAAFKMFFVDVGLLSARCKLSAAVILEGNKIFGQYKGALTEQFVQQELKSELGIQPYYWSAERAQAEIDFLIETDRDIIPIEVKAERNLQAKSLHSFYKRFHRPLAIRISAHTYAEQNIAVPETKNSPAGSYLLVDLPLYTTNQLIHQIESIDNTALNP